MTARTLTAFSTLLFLGGIANTLSAESDASNRGDGSPSGFATVSQAKTTKIVKGVKQSKPQAAYLGLIAVDRDGELVVQEVAPDSAGCDIKLIESVDSGLQFDGCTVGPLRGLGQCMPIDCG